MEGRQPFYLCLFMFSLPFSSSSIQTLLKNISKIYQEGRNFVFLKISAYLMERKSEVRFNLQKFWFCHPVSTTEYGKTLREEIIGIYGTNRKSYYNVLLNVGQTSDTIFRNLALISPGAHRHFYIKASLITRYTIFA